MTEKILVTGGLGMVGACMCRGLVEEGFRPVIFDVSTNTRLIADIADKCEVIQGSVGDLPAMMDAIKRAAPPAIVHLSGLVGPGVEFSPWASLTTNLMGTTNVFEAARLSGVKRVIFPSSKMAYGPVKEEHRAPNYVPVPEDHPLNPPKLYGKIKVACENVAEHYAKLYGMHIIAVRFGSAFAPGKLGRNDKVSPVMAIIEAAAAGKPIRVPKGGEEKDGICYSAESANGIIAALKSPLREGTFRPYNIASDDVISLNEMIKVLQDMFPGWQGEAGPGLDYRGMGSGYYFAMDTTRAKQEIGFRSKYDFRRSAEDYVETLRRLAG
jgi:UDP-glucose 4-epimerase